MYQIHWIAYWMDHWIPIISSECMSEGLSAGEGVCECAREY